MRHNKGVKFVDDRHVKEYSEVLGRHIEVETALYALEKYTPEELFSDLMRELELELKKAASELDKLSEAVRIYLDSLKKEDANADIVFENVRGKLGEVSGRMLKSMEQDRKLIARSAELKSMYDVHNLRLQTTRDLLDTTGSYRKFALEVIEVGYMEVYLQFAKLYNRLRFQYITRRLVLSLMQGSVFALALIVFAALYLTEALTTDIITYVVRHPYAVVLAIVILFLVDRWVNGKAERVKRRMLCRSLHQVANHLLNLRIFNVEVRAWSRKLSTSAQPKTSP